MNLPIIQSILHGALRPNIVGNLCFRELSNTFANLPNQLAEIEKLFITHLSNYAQFNFENEKPCPLGDYATDFYTPINTQSFDNLLLLEIPYPTSPKEKFYQIIVRAEFHRVKHSIIDFAIIHRSNIDTRCTIKETLQNILRYSKNTDSDDVIISTLKIQLLCFYEELIMIASPILTENADYLSFEDLMFEMFGRYPQNEENETYQSFVTKPNISTDAVEKKGNLPTTEEYQQERFTTNYETFVEEVEKYRFSELKSVCKLSNQNKINLIHLITSNDANYAVPMLKHIGYYDKLKQEFNLNNEQVFKHWAKALGRSERAIKGNFNALNPYSKENKYRYNSESFVEKVALDYEKLLL